MASIINEHFVASVLKRLPGFEEKTGVVADVVEVCGENGRVKGTACSDNWEGLRRALIKESQDLPRDKRFPVFYSGMYLQCPLGITLDVRRENRLGFQGVGCLEAYRKLTSR